MFLPSRISAIYLKQMQHPGNELLRSYHKILGKRIVNALKSFGRCDDISLCRAFVLSAIYSFGPDLVFVSNYGPNSCHFELSKSFDIINPIPVQGEKVLYMI